MITNSHLSGVLNALLHLIGKDRPTSSDVLGKVMGTNPVIVRRLMAGVRERGYVTSAPGPTGGWLMASDPAELTLLDIYEAIGEPRLLAISNRSDTPRSPFEGKTNATLNRVFEAAEGLIRRELGAMTLEDLRSTKACVAPPGSGPAQDRPAAEGLSVFRSLRSAD